MSMFNNNNNNNFMSSRGVETNPWNRPQDDDYHPDWYQGFTRNLSEEVQARLLQYQNVPDDDYSFVSDDSDATTMLVDDDNDDYDDDDAASVQQQQQQQEISSSTSTIATLNVINMMDIQKEKLWMLQPAWNSVYNCMDSVPTCHFKKSTGSYQMDIDKQYNNALLTPLCQNTCLVPSRDRCLLETVKGSLLHLMIAMKRYPTLKPAEKENLNANFCYLADLIAKMEAGFKAHREWNTVIQSLFHQRDYQSSNTRDLESIDLSFEVKKATKQCPELTTLDEQPALTVLFEQYQKMTPTKPMNVSEWNEKEIEAHKMYLMFANIEEMMTKLVNM